MREKLNYLNETLQKFHQKHSKVTSYINKNTNLRDEAIIKSNELESEIQQRRERRQRHLAILRSTHDNILKDIDAKHKKSSLISKHFH